MLEVTIFIILKASLCFLDGNLKYSVSIFNHRRIGLLALTASETLARDDCGRPNAVEVLILFIE